MSKLAKVLQAAAGNAGGAGDLAAAIDFDGTNDYLSRSSDLTGNADSKTFTFSMWVYRPVDQTGYYYEARTTGGLYRFFVSINASENVRIVGKNSGGTTIFDFETSTKIPFNTWTHIILSIDLANTSNRYVYINDVSASAVYLTYTNNSIAFSGGTHGVAANGAGGSKVEGRLSNVFLDYTYRDLSVTNNRRLFITEDGKPADGQASVTKYGYTELAVGSQDTFPNEVFMSTDGTKFYMVGKTTDTVYQYDLSTAYDVSSATYNSVSFSVASQSTEPMGVSFSTDGTKMYIVEASNGIIYQYTLTTGFDLSTASYASKSFDTSSQRGGQEVQDVSISSDGTRLYIIVVNHIYEYTLSTAYDVSSATYNSKTYNYSSQVPAGVGMAFGNSGTKMYVMGAVSAVVTIFEYTLSTAWDVSTASYSGNSFVAAGRTNDGTGLALSSNGEYLYSVGSTGDTVFQYGMSTAYDLSTASASSPVGSPTAPIMYMPLDDPEDIGYNAGTGGDFTVNGVMARSGRGPNQYNAAASTFESGDYVRAASLPNITSTGYTISVNVKTDLSSQSAPFLVEANSTNVQAQLSILTTGVLRFNAADYNTSSTIMRITADNVLSAGRWYNIQAVVDPAVQANNKLYVDGVEVDVTFVTFVSRTNHILSQNAQVGNATGSEISDVWFADTKVDLSSDNPFYDTETGKPKYLGASGELPTGSSPLIYLPLRGNDAGNNLGTGGDFTTVSGGPYVGARGPSEFLARSVSFNGTNQSLTRATTLTGAKSAGSGFTFALSVKVPSTTTYFPIYVGKDIGVANYLLFALGNNKMYATVPFYNYCDTDNNSISGLANTWINVLFTVTKNGSWQYWINGVDKSEGAGTFTATSDFDFTSIDTSIIGTNGSADYAPASLGFFWATDEYIDFSQEATRLKFFDALGYPVDLGSDGSTPTGNLPLIYMNNDFHLGTNSGGGGNFSPDNAPPAGPDVGS
jgi:hypothetical protein